MNAAKRCVIKSGVQYCLTDKIGNDVGSLIILPDGFAITIVVNRATGKTKERTGMTPSQLNDWADKYNIGWKVY